METQGNTATLPSSAKARAKASRATFLRAYVENGGHVAKAAAVAGVSRVTVWKWRRKSARFREAFEVATDAAVSALEDEAVRRAVHGIDRIRFDPKGKKYIEKAFSDKLLVRLLEAKHPAFRRRVDVEHSGQLTLVDALSAVRRIRDAELLDDGSTKQIEGPAESP